MITEDYSSQGLLIESMNQEIYIPEGFEATIKGNRIILKKTISEDEKIRKDIIAFIKKRDRSGCDYDYDKWIAWLEKQGEQKPAAWSDEDEHRIEDTIYFLDTAKKHYACTIELDACIDWLKSLKNRIGG